MLIMDLHSIVNVIHHTECTNTLIIFRYFHGEKQMQQGYIEAKENSTQEAVPLPGYLEGEGYKAHLNMLR